jgi:streptogramin lyase
MYSFGIDPENDKYTGSIHMGKQQFDLRFNPCSFSINVRVYMRSFNIMEIRGGKLRVLYPCPVYIENIFNSKIISTKTSATGGTVTNVGLKKIHTFNSSGTFTVEQGGQVEVLVVGGGGGGGGSYIDYSTTNLNNFSYGGGAGGVVYETAYNLTQGTYNVIIGSGGSGGTGSNFTKIFSGNSTSFSVTPVHKTINGARTGGGTVNIYNGSVGTNGNKYYYYFNSTSNPGGNGANSSFGDITAIGGGGGGTGSFVSINTYAAQTGGTGGSGGGNGGIGTTGQGNNAWTSGGGGAGASGTPVSYSISGTAAFYGGGGTNGNIPSIPSTDTQILTGLVDPKTIAFNPAGLAVFPTLFSYCDQTNVNVRAKAFIETIIADVPTLTGLERVVSDNTGILYGSDATQNSIFKISPSGATLFASGFINLYTFVTIPSGAGTRSQGVVSSTTDSNRNLYIIDNGTTIYKITPSGTKTTFSTGFTTAVGLVADSTNNIYVIDGTSIFKITQASVKTTITSGGITYTGASNITIDVNSNLYVSSVFRTTILKITQAGVVTTFTTMSGSVQDITIDSSGNMYILLISVDAFAGTSVNNSITLINIATPSTTYKFPNITTTLESLQTGPSNLLYGAVNDYVSSIFSVISMSTVNFTDVIVTTQASSMNLTGIVSDSSGRLYIMEETIVSKITISNLVNNGYSPSASVVVTVFATGFTNLKGIAADSSGNLYVSDGNQIKKITLSGTVSIFAGSTSSGFTNGSGTNAIFNNPWGLAVDSSDNIYVADSGNNVIRMITPSGTVSTFAGTGAAGNVDGNALTVATFNGPKFVTFYSSYGLIVGDTGNSVLRLINSGLTASYDVTNGGGEISTVLGGGQIYTINSVGTACAYTLSPSVTSGILIVGRSSITSYILSVDFPSPPTGYCADSTFVYASCGPPNSLVLQYQSVPPFRSYDLQIIGISQYIYQGLAFDSNGNIYCSDTSNQITKNVKFYAKGFTSPRGIVVDPSGNLFVSDTSSIKKVDTSGVVTTFTTANISQAQGIDRDSSGNIYITDTGTNDIKKYNSSGTLVQTYNADLNNPQGLIVDTNGNIYVADKGNNVIKLITPSGSVAILPVTTFSPQDVTLDPSGTLYYVDSLNACQVTNKITTTSSTGAITIPNNTGTGAVLNGNTNNAPSIAGTANTGGGGGGAVSIYPNGSGGGSGVVIVSYPQ